MQPPDHRFSCQQRFHQRWKHLRDPHVRTLAWLLDSPDLLDPEAPQWRGRIASLGSDAASNASAWLQQLDRNPEPLHDCLAVHPLTRLGRYAEQLLTWYFRQQGTLVAQGLQVRDGGTTIGEFDFLLRDRETLVHWELATKVYLLQPDAASGIRADYFVGPNLADTLGAKMSKIINRQLALSGHPASHSVLPGEIGAVAALIKGWLFYPDSAQVAIAAAGLAANHCRGFWSEARALSLDPHQRYLLLDRLQWLAPVAVNGDDAVPADRMPRLLSERFALQETPVMIAKLKPDGEEEGRWIETERGFVVPDGWPLRSRRVGASFSPFADRSAD